MCDFPNATIIYNTNKLKNIENKIEEIKMEHKKLNRNCEIKVISNPDPKMINFDGHTEIEFQLSIYIKHLSYN
ncbi:hypothetical protein AB8U03_12740 [Clostridium sp. Mt-5]|uniref:Uncharacterized protein n=1 Tax=Clostridium moutaii TaxID=3240932 RepID=A0ABV4BQJ1_9CLOT